MRVRYCTLRGGGQPARPLWSGAPCTCANVDSLRALQLNHGWTAVGESAVEAHGLPHPWSMHEGLITIASAHTSSNPYGGRAPAVVGRPLHLRKCG